MPQVQAKQLIAVARPARYGRGEQTLLDRRVRDTWEVPLSRVKIDKRRWQGALRAVLDQLRVDLGMADGCELKTELHSMLVYGPGQFFVPHQDSEKDDAMVGSLVVTLPSTFTGGDLVVEHGRETKTYRGSKNALSLVAFYADCRHQIRPVRSGYRIVLTYNLLLRSDAPSEASAPMEATTVGAATASVEGHFATSAAPRWRDDSAAGEPPTRLVYLLDHEYTRRGLSWSRLKGSDARRAAVLREVAERADCDVVLALADVHETWSCYEPDDRYYGHGGSGYRRWGDDGYGEDAFNDADVSDDSSDLDDYQVDELVDSEVTLDSWTGAAGEPAQPVASFVGHEELCASTPSSDLRPYAAEYEGYMGNYGNTLDRWYHRGAVVLWPRQLGFRVRAEASPEWAIEELSKLLRAGELDQAQDNVRTLEPIWDRIVGDGATTSAFVNKTLLVACGLDDRTTGSWLLAPLVLPLLDPDHASALVGLDDAYGGDWVSELVDRWSFGGAMRGSRPDWLTWIASLSRLSEALVAAGPGGLPVARRLAQLSWTAVRDTTTPRRDMAPPSRRAEALDELAKPILGLLETTAVLGDTDLRDQVVRFLCDDPDRSDDLLPVMVTVLQEAYLLEAETCTTAGLDEVAQHCQGRLEARLARPRRAADDWSIELPPGCACDLCETLGMFLTDPARQVNEWPIAKDKRQHVHTRIDGAELPVRHETRRQGRPYTLILSKAKDLFRREEQTRRLDEANLAWLTTDR
ncbi:MAG: 2OG-Fe(II) oxygenase [Acidimicrobiales bacterium]